MLYALSRIEFEVGDEDEFTMNLRSIDTSIYHLYGNDYLSLRKD